MKVKIGTCGFQKSRKAHYSNLDVLEVQQTFYDPRTESYSKWRKEASSTFEFTIKAWMLITHEYNKNLWSKLKEEIPGRLENYGSLKLTEEVLWAWEKTLEVADALSSKIIVVQTPPSFSFNEVNKVRALEFFKNVPRRGKIIVWEPRGDWWNKPDELVNVATHAEVVIGGDALRGRVLKEQREIAYFRLHGLGGQEVNYRYKYTDEDLLQLKKILEELNPEVAYVLFNNVYSFEDALRFKKLLLSY
ncbi:MAG: DUF72 domain-containing protein [Acidilobaceae archaeon]